MNGVLVDTGFLVALFRRNDVLRPAAREYLQRHGHPLATISAVIVESCFFLNPAEKSALLEWALRGALRVADVPLEAYAEIKAVIEKYADRDIDFADAALVWFGGVSGCRSILTIDTKDFGILKIKGSKSFDVVRWVKNAR